MSSNFRSLYSEKYNRQREVKDIRSKASNQLKETRKSGRNAALNVRRHIEVVKEEVRKRTSQDEKQERLQLYRAEKLKRMEKEKLERRPPFCSIVKVRHTGATPFRVTNESVLKVFRATKKPEIVIPPNTRSKTKKYNQFEFKAGPSAAKKTEASETQNTNKKPNGLFTTKIQPLRSNETYILAPENGRRLARPEVEKKPPSNPKENGKADNPRKGEPSSSTENIPMAISRPQSRTLRNRALTKPASQVAVKKIQNGLSKKPTAMIVSNRKIAAVKQGVSNSPDDGEQIAEKDSISKKPTKRTETEDRKEEEPATCQTTSVHQEDMENKLVERITEVMFMSPITRRNTRRHPAPRPSPESLEDEKKQEQAVDVSDVPTTPRKLQNGLSPMIRRSSRRQHRQEQTKEEKIVENKVGERLIGPTFHRKRLQNEIDRLRERAERWSVVKTGGGDLPSHVEEEIAAVVGQTRLLLTSKFMQFKSLIDMAEAEGGSTQKVTSQDLDGFWEMMYQQVEQLDGKYKNLDDLKNNKWLPIIRQVTKDKPKVRKKNKKSTHKIKVSSKFKDFIKKTSEVKKESTTLNEDLTTKEDKTTPEQIGEEFSVRLSLRDTPLMKKVLSSAQKARRSSAGLITLKNSFRAKSIVMSSPFQDGE